MVRQRRLLILGLLLVLVIGAVIWLSYGEVAAASVIEPTERIAVQIPHAALSEIPVQSSLPLDKLSRLSVPVGDVDPFAPKSWYVPPPLPPPQALAVPAAPPLPFTFVGKLEDEDGSWVIYLAKGAESFIVKKGDTFNGSYRLENLENGNLIIQYLPLKTNQILRISVALQKE